MEAAEYRTSAKVDSPTRRLLLVSAVLAGVLAIVAHALSIGALTAVFPTVWTTEPLQTSFNASLPNVTIFATGGTIAGKGSSSTLNSGYDVAVSAQELIDAVPEILQYANVEGLQVSEVISTNMNQTILLELHKLVLAEVLKPNVCGVVLTHGTDTLEETCFFLHLTVQTDKPIVCTASMRPSTSLSADGPANLLQSVVLATAPNARHRGAMVSLNDKIISAVFANKNHANNPNTFYSVDAGTLGYYINSIPYFYFPAAKPIGTRYFDISAAESLPRIDILYSHQDMDPGLPNASITLGAKGLVFAGNGDGCIAHGAYHAAQGIHNATGITVVTSHKVPNGWANTDGFAIGSAHLNPAKARILLQLAVYEGLDDEEVGALFDAFRPNPWVDRTADELSKRGQDKDLA